MIEHIFDIVYNGQIIKVEPGSNYRLTFPDGRWLLIGRHPDDTRTTSVENANISYSMAFVWVVEDASPEPNWLNHEQVQIVGELIKIKEMKLEKEGEQ